MRRPNRKVAPANPRSCSVRNTIRPPSVRMNPASSAIDTPSGSFSRCHVISIPAAMKIALANVDDTSAVRTLAIAAVAGRYGCRSITFAGSPPIEAAGTISFSASSGQPYRIKGAESAATEIRGEREPPSDGVEKIDDQLEPDDENDLRSDQLEIFDEARVTGFIDEVNEQGRSEAKGDQLLVAHSGPETLTSLTLTPTQRRNLRRAVTGQPASLSGQGISSIARVARFRNFGRALSDRSDLRVALLRAEFYTP